MVVLPAEASRGGLTAGCRAKEAERAQSQNWTLADGFLSGDLPSFANALSKTCNIEPKPGKREPLSFKFFL